MAIGPLHAAGFTGQADFILKLAPQVRNADVARTVCSDHDLIPKSTTPIHGVVAVRLAPTADELSVQRLRTDPRIETIERDDTVWIARRRHVPGDPHFGRQWALYNRHLRGADAHVTQAWTVFRGSRRVVVGIIDTGIDYLHPELAGNMWINPVEIPGNGIDDDRNGYVDDYHGWDFNRRSGNPMDRGSHGTHVAGIVGAVRDNDQGIAGVSPHVSLMALKGISDKGTGFLSDLIEAVYYAIDNGAHVINASWGSGGYSVLLREAIAYGARHDVLFVAAAGNNGRDIDRKPFYPASYDLDNIISVGSSDSTDARSDFTNYGYRSVDLFAPGSHIISTVPGGGVAVYYGTSMSAPFVAGALALLVGALPDVRYTKYIGALLAGGDVNRHFQGGCTSGGRLNVYRGLRALLRNRRGVGGAGGGPLPPHVVHSVTLDAVREAVGGQP